MHLFLSLVLALARALAVALAFALALALALALAPVLALARPLARLRFLALSLCRLSLSNALALSLTRSLALSFPRSLFSSLSHALALSRSCSLALLLTRSLFSSRSRSCFHLSRTHTHTLRAHFMPLSSIPLSLSLSDAWFKSIHDSKSRRVYLRSFLFWTRRRCHSSHAGETHSYHHICLNQNPFIKKSNLGF